MFLPTIKAPNLRDILTSGILVFISANNIGCKVIFLIFCLFITPPKARNTVHTIHVDRKRLRVVPIDPLKVFRNRFLFIY